MLVSKNVYWKIIYVGKNSSYRVVTFIVTQNTDLGIPVSHPHCSATGRCQKCNRFWISRKRIEENKPHHFLRCESKPSYTVNVLLGVVQTAQETVCQNAKKVEKTINYEMFSEWTLIACPKPFQDWKINGGKKNKQQQKCSIMVNRAIL